MHNMSKSRKITTLVDQLSLVVEVKEAEVISYGIDDALNVHLPPKLKSKLVEAIRLSPEKSERLIRIANMVDAKQLEYTLDKNLY